MFAMIVGGIYGCAFIFLIIGLFFYVCHCLMERYHFDWADVIGCIAIFILLSVIAYGLLYAIVYIGKYLCHQ